jgi:hypothetical protein
MANVTYFVQDCPTCGRKLNIRVEYLGKNVVCQHCRGPFLAWDQEGAPTGGDSVLSGSSSMSSSKLLDRAQELIDMAEQKIAESRIIRAKMDAETANVSR